MLGVLNRAAFRLGIDNASFFVSLGLDSRPLPKYPLGESLSVRPLIATLQVALQILISPQKSEEEKQLEGENTDADKEEQQLKDVSLNRSAMLYNTPYKY